MEAIFSPDFLVPDEGYGFAVWPDTVRKYCSNLPVLLPPTDIVSLYFHPIRGMDCRLIFDLFRREAETGSFIGVRKHMHRLNTIEINRI